MKSWGLPNIVRIWKSMSFIGPYMATDSFGSVHWQCFAKTFLFPDETYPVFSISGKKRSKLDKFLPWWARGSANVPRQSKIFRVRQGTGSSDTK